MLNQFEEYKVNCIRVGNFKLKRDSRQSTPVNAVHAAIYIFKQLIKYLHCLNLTLSKYKTKDWT